MNKLIVLVIVSAIIGLVLMWYISFIDNNIWWINMVATVLVCLPFAVSIVLSHSSSVDKSGNNE